ncbi:MAG: sigma 54-interacting transcriptional regulator [Polyangiales bacterium]
MDDVASLQTRASTLPVGRVLGLRILAHPDLERVGSLCAPLMDTELSRLAPTFPDGPLASLHVSRTAVTLMTRADGIVLRGEAHARLAVEGSAVDGEHALSTDELDAGVVLTLGRAVALWLGHVEPGSRPRLPGFVGVSALSAALQRRLAQLATQDTHVLLHGPSGAGKRTAARVLHSLGPRGMRPLTNGLEDETPYIPELCALDAEQQQALRARLGRGRVLAGCAHERPCELAASFQDSLPVQALRERPEDIAPLFAHFVAEALRNVGALARFRARDTEPAFVPAALLPRLVRASWPNNAHQLRAFAEAYVLAQHDQASADLARWSAAIPGAER